MMAMTKKKGTMRSRPTAAAIKQSEKNSPRSVWTIKGPRRKTVKQSRHHPKPRREARPAVDLTPARRPGFHPARPAGEFEKRMVAAGLRDRRGESRDVAAYRIVPPGMDPARLAVERSVTMNDQNT